MEPTMYDEDRSWITSGKIQVEEKQRRQGTKTQDGEPYWMHMAKRNKWIPPKPPRAPDSEFSWKIFFLVMLPFAPFVLPVVVMAIGALFKMLF